MYITRVEIQNIRSIRHLVWEIDAANAPGWHVILGDNGSGKSTFVRTAALGIIGSSRAQLLKQDWATWITNNGENATLQVSFDLDSKYDFRRLSHEIVKDIFDSHLKDSTYSRWKTELLIQVDHIDMGDNFTRIGDILTGHAYDSATLHHNKQFTGFASSFGPFRRFTGGDPEDDKLHKTNPPLSRHLSVFSERTALTEPLKWFQLLRLKSHEGDIRSTWILSNVMDFINSGDLLPSGTQLTEVTSAGVKFRDGNGSEILVEEMSDGYRSVLSLTFELLRQLSIAYGADIFETHENGKVTVKVPGVVQIDEVDAHLHPTWQKRIGFWFREHFPQMQFIVTTHSPLVCQAAEQGSIFLLPRPGTDETGRMLQGAERDRLLYGDITDAYSTEAFGGGDTRSPKGQEMLDRLGELNVKELRQGLTAKERKEQERLRQSMPSSATALSEMP